MRCKPGSPIRRALKLAKASPLPPEAAQLKHQKKKMLVGLCRVLQCEAGDAPFYLTCRAAGELFGVSHKTAAAWLKSLSRREILRVVETGTFVDHRGSRYRYVAR